MPISSLFLRSGSMAKLAVLSLMASAAAAQGLADYTYIGCTADISTRLLTGPHTYDLAMTNEMCAATCAGYQYFGTEYKWECYCGNDFSGGVATQVGEGACALTCGGDDTEICGGPMLLSLYELTADMGTPAAASSTVDPAAATTAAASSTVDPAAPTSPAAASSTADPAAASSTVDPAADPAAASSTIDPAAASSTFAAASSTLDLIFVAAASSTTIGGAALSFIELPGAASSTAAASSYDSAATSLFELPGAASSTYAAASSTALAMVTPSASLTLSTVYSTTIYTITSCAATVTDCPARLGSVTTDIISLYTTWCPGNVTPAPTPSASSQKTIELFTTVVVTSYVDYCPETGELTTITTSQTQVLPYPSGGAVPTEAYIPMVTTTTLITLNGEATTAILTIPYPTITRSPPQVTPAANVVVGGTSTLLVVPMQSGPVYPAGNATANAGIASGTVSLPKQSASTYTGGAKAKEWSLGAGVLALGAAMVML